MNVDTEKSKYNNPFDYIFSGDHSSIINRVVGGRAPLISVYEINDMRKGLRGLFDSDQLPEINQIKLYRVEGGEKAEVKVRIGNCEHQRKIWAYRHGGKTKTRLIKHADREPLNLNNLKFNPKFKYSVSFKCALCGNHTTMRITSQKTRKTPVCKTHIQEMYVRKVRKIRSSTPKHKYRLWKTIYNTEAEN